MGQMNLKRVEPSIVLKIISNVTTQNVSTNRSCAMEKMIAEMEAMSPPSTHVVLLMSSVNLAFGLALGFQMFALTKERFAMTNQIVPTEQMKDQYVTMLIVIITVDNVPMVAFKHLSEHFVHVPPVKC